MKIPIIIILVLCIITVNAFNYSQVITWRLDKTITPKTDHFDLYYTYDGFTRWLNMTDQEIETFRLKSLEFFESRFDVPLKHLNLTFNETTHETILPGIGIMVPLHASTHNDFILASVTPHSLFRHYQPSIGYVGFVLISRDAEMERFSLFTHGKFYIMDRKYKEVHRLVTGYSECPTYFSSLTDVMTSRLLLWDREWGLGSSEISVQLEFIKMSQKALQIGIEISDVWLFPASTSKYKC